MERVYAVNGDVVARIPVTCAALADEVDMMKPFELGARAVVVRRCSTCRYRGAEDRIDKRVARTRQILDAAGVGGDKLESSDLTPLPEEETRNDSCRQQAAC